MKKFFTMLICVFAALSFNAAASTLTLYFSTDNFKLFDDPGQYVSVYNVTTGQTIEHGYYYDTYDFTGETQFKISPKTDGTCSLKVTINAGTGTLTQQGQDWFLTTSTNMEISMNVIPYVAPDVKIYDQVDLTFNVTSSSGSDIPDAYQYITITYWDKTNAELQEVSKTLESANQIITVPAGVQIEVHPSGLYMVDGISSDNEGITISDTGSIDGYYAFQLPDEPTWNTATVNVSVSKTPANVYVLFECNDPDANTSTPQDFVTVSYNPVSPETEAQDNGWRVFVSGESQEITVAPITNYGIADVTITNNEGISVAVEDLLTTYGASCTETDGIYTISVSDKSSGLVFLFDVEPTAIEGVDIAINFTGENLENDAYTYVTVVEGIRPVEVDSDEFTYVYRYPDTAVNLYFIPAEGYLVNVTCQNEDGDDYGTIEADDSRGVGAVAVAIPVEESGSSANEEGTIPEGLVITVTVYEDNTEAVSTIGSSVENVVIYNINGVKVNKENVAKGLYIIDGKKVMIGK